jgi:hypothetical protein
LRAVPVVAAADPTGEGGEHAVLVRKLSADDSIVSLVAITTTATTTTTTMIYLTHARLMLESEQAVVGRAAASDELPRRICRQLLADGARYALWHVRHDGHMGAVAKERRRPRQILSLRSISVEQIHRAALVSYLRERQVAGRARAETLREFYGVTDPSEAAITEHRNYLLAASTQFCAADILAMAGDRRGLELLHGYELAYGQYFAMFCERARARQAGASYLLAALIPEVRGVAGRIRARLMDDRSVSSPPIGVAGAQIASGGRRDEDGVLRSNACASSSTSRSRPRRPTICRPIGKPSRVNPAGTEIAGRPVHVIA